MDKSERRGGALSRSDFAFRGPRARPGRIAERLADKRLAARSDSLDRVLDRQPTRLQQFVEFVRELVGDRAPG